MQPQRATWRLYWDTIRHLQGEQVLYQLWRPLQPYLWPRPHRQPDSISVRPGWGPRVARPHGAADAAVLQGRFRFWGIERRLDLQHEWRAEDLGSSWNFPVHYFDACAALAAQAERTPQRDAALRQHLLTWIEQHPIERGDAWHPYTTSLRVVNWLEVLSFLQEGADRDWTREVLHSLYRQVDSLPSRLERHLLGTHLLKNLKAILIGASVFAGERMRRFRQQALRLLSRELRTQVHADGGHREPSAMYHCMATGDLLDLLNFRDALPPDAAEATRRVAARMLGYASAVQTPQGDYPLQGDAWRGGEWTPRQLLSYGRRLGLEVEAPGNGLTCLLDSGVAVWRSPRHWLFADLAPVGPPHLPSHGHCDSLSFEWQVDGVPLIVDAGTYSYEDGALRQECRSTSAHNTLQIDGEELHEIWSRFRVARRSSVRAHRVGENEVEATLRPWFAPHLLVQRTLRFEAETIHVDDRVQGDGEHTVVSRLHLHPECTVQRQADGVVTLQRGAVRAQLHWQGGAIDVLSSGTSGSRIAEEAGCLLPNAVIVLRHQGPLPVASRLVLRANGRSSS